MAVSAETKAIIDRLKAEGDLIRNTGTNSLKEVGIKLDKFNDVFNSISTNIAAQTRMMEVQAGIAQEQLEKKNTQEQLDEIEQKQKVKDDSESINKIDKSIDDMSESIKNALSMKSVLGGMKDLAVAAGAAFVGYNLLKGFIDDQYDGAFTKMETGIVDLAKGFGDVDVTKMTKNLTDFIDSLPNLTDMINTITTGFKDFQEAWNKYSWGDIILGIFNAMSAMTLSILALRTFGPAIRRLLDRKMLDLGATEAERAAARAAAKAGANVTEELAEKGLKAAGLAASGAVVYQNADGVFFDESGKPMAQDAIPEHLRPAAPKPRTFGYDEFGQLVGKDGKPLKGAALNAAQTAMKGDKALAEAAAEQARRQAAAIDAYRQAGNMYPNGRPTGNPGSYGKALASRLKGKIITEATKRAWKVAVQALPLVGAIVGAGFALWNLFKGDYTSASLQGSSVFMPTVTGTAVDITSIATEIFFMLYVDESGNKDVSYNPTNPDHRAFMEEIAKACYEAAQNYLDTEQKRASAEKRMAYETATPEEQARMTAEAERMAWSYQNTPGGPVHHLENTREQNATLQQLLNDPNNLGNYSYDPTTRSVIFTPGNGGSKVNMGKINEINARPMTGNAQSYGVLASDVQGGRGNYYDHRTYAPMAFNNQDAGDNVQMISFAEKQAEADASISAFGLTSAFNTRFP